MTTRAVRATHTFRRRHVVATSTIVTPNVDTTPNVSTRKSVSRLPHGLMTRRSHAIKSAPIPEHERTKPRGTVRACHLSSTPADRKAAMLPNQESHPTHASMEDPEERPENSKAGYSDINAT